MVKACLVQARDNTGKVQLVTSLFFQPSGALESYQAMSTRCQSAQLCFQALLTSVH